jgi:hypothetical protein
MYKKEKKKKEKTVAHRYQTFKRNVNCMGVPERVKVHKKSEKLGDGSVHLTGYSASRSMNHGGGDGRSAAHR